MQAPRGRDVPVAQRIREGERWLAVYVDLQMCIQEAMRLVAPDPAAMQPTPAVSEDITLLAEHSIRYGERLAYWREVVGSPHAALEAVVAVRGGHPAMLGHLAVDPRQRTVEHGGARHTLSPNEWQLFHAFLECPGDIRSRSDLAIGAWGDGSSVREAEVEVYVARLRRKIEVDPRRPAMIVTVHRRGYRLVLPAALAPSPIASPAAG